MKRLMVTVLCFRKWLCHLKLLSKKSPQSKNPSGPEASTLEINLWIIFLFWSTESLLQYILQYCHNWLSDSLVWKAEPQEMRECCTRLGISQLWRYWSFEKKTNEVVKLMPSELKTGLLHDNCFRIFHWKGLCFWLQHESFPYAVKFNSVSIPFLRRLWPPLLWCCELKFKTYLRLKLFLLSLQILVQTKDENQNTC